MTLSDTVAQVNGNVRQRLALDAPAEDVPALGHTPPGGEAEAVAPSRKNGRKAPRA